MKRMKKHWMITAVFMGVALTAQAQTQPEQPSRLGKLLERILAPSGNGLTSEEITRGLKEALQIGINKGSDRASAVDGYYKNPLIKILMPPEAQQLERRLRQIGLGPQVDRFVLSLNRAAEDAAKEAKPIFLNALFSMSIQDALGILRGEPNAATQYLKRTTSEQLMQRFTPIVDSTLTKNRATRYYGDLVRTYNRLPGVQRVDPDLTRYATTKAVDGIFTLIEQEEREIRKNPAARVTELLRRVFGS